MKQMVLQHKLDLIQAGLHASPSQLQAAQSLSPMTLEKIH